MFNSIFTQSQLRALLLFMFITININNGFSQLNLVPNPSFEQYTNCPQGYWHEGPDFWYQPDKGGGGIGMLVEAV